MRHRYVYIYMYASKLLATSDWFLETGAGLILNNGGGHASPLLRLTYYQVCTCGKWAWRELAWICYSCVTHSVPWCCCYCLNFPLPVTHSQDGSRVAVGVAAGWRQGGSKVPAGVAAGVSFVWWKFLEIDGNLSFDKYLEIV